MSIPVSVSVSAPSRSVALLPVLTIDAPFLCAPIASSELLCFAQG